MAHTIASGVSGGLFVELLDRAALNGDGDSPPRPLEAWRRARRRGRARARARPSRATPRAYVADPEGARAPSRVLVELAASPDLRAALEEVSAGLCRFPAQVEGATGTGRYDPNLSGYIV